MVDSYGHGENDIGDDGPELSWDGQWLAFTNRGVLEVARLDGSAAHRITEHSPDGVNILIAGFSPDSNTLLFHQSVNYDAVDPARDDFPAGFYLTGLEHPEPVRLEELKGFAAWSANPGVILRASERGDTQVLSAFDLGTRRERMLQPLRGSQLSFAGEFVAYNWGGR